MSTPKPKNHSNLHPGNTGMSQAPAPVADASIQKGDRVRSYDFPGLPGLPPLPGAEDHYVEGLVRGFKELEGCMRYEIEVERRVRQGVEDRKTAGTFVYPPVNGTPTLLGGSTHGVVRLPPDAPVSQLPSTEVTAAMDLASPGGPGDCVLRMLEPISLETLIGLLQVADANGKDGRPKANYSRVSEMLEGASDRFVKVEVSLSLLGYFSPGNQARVESYKAMGGAPPPVLISWNSRAGRQSMKAFVSDGLHRCTAAEQLGVATIQAVMPESHFNRMSDRLGLREAGRTPR